MRTFSDFKFKDHKSVANGMQALLQVGDFRVSVVSMKGENPKTYGGLYGNASQGTYEVAVFEGNDMLPLHIYDDVRGWQTEDELNELLASLQADDAQGFVQKLRDDKQEYRKEMELD